MRESWREFPVPVYTAVWRMHPDTAGFISSKARAYDNVNELKKKKGVRVMTYVQYEKV